MPAGDTDPVKTCPSARCAPGATLMGVKGADGRIANLRTAMVIDEDFVAKAKLHGSPEKRMRFASPCQTKGCSQWTGERCGVIDRVLTHLEGQTIATRDTLPSCVIRSSCRWHSQIGARACFSCELVVTDLTAVPAE